MACIWWPQDTLFPARGEEKCPRECNNMCQKSALRLTFYNKINGERVSFCNFSSQQNALQIFGFSKTKTMKKYVGEWVAKKHARQHEKCPTHLPTNN